MPVLHFDPEDHRYTLDGTEVPGVTTALKVVSAADYAMVDPELLATKARFGQAVHRLIELDCLGELDLVTLDDDLEPYYLAWREFLAASGFQVLLSESKVYSARYGYAGMLDLFGRLNGIPSLVDAKCVACVMPSTGPQTAAYENALRETRPHLLAAGAPCRRYALQLRPNAKPGAARWQLVPFTNPADFRVFLSSLTITQWRKTA